ncbi:TPA: hypothetical protein U1339_001536 [Streptococcus suis]|uniref:hypothetical protein n=1 Tax=Streptococcus suis TaxID=1307 RepID=UPI0004625FD5|nr:hypothetical protein [Streptococcus suis]HEM3181348.1 hypothetical protein [Streptococcus suis 89-5259]HEM5046283.1 hypothetical protein [Streptococcus suis]HEM5265551.1 hypothetical protein [Streptococcus suis]
MEKIIIACIIGIFIYCIRNFFIGQRPDVLLNQGAIESRDKLFLSQEHCFFSSKISSVQEILSVLDMGSFKDNHIQLINATKLNKIQQTVINVRNYNFFGKLYIEVLQFK